MTAYIIRRLIATIPILLGAATIVFALMFVVPGDPARLLMGQHGDERTLAALRHEMGLDRPVYIQYARFIGRLMKGDLGMSYRQKRPVAEIIRDRSRQPRSSRWRACSSRPWSASRRECLRQCTATVSGTGS